MIHERGKECFDTGTNWDKSTGMEKHYTKSMASFPWCGYAHHESCRQLIHTMIFIVLLILRENMIHHYHDQEENRENSDKDGKSAPYQTMREWHRVVTNYG